MQGQQAAANPGSSRGTQQVQRQVTNQGQPNQQLPPRLANS